MRRLFRVFWREWSCPVVLDGGAFFVSVADISIEGGRHEGEGAHHGRPGDEPGDPAHRLRDRRAEPGDGERRPGGDPPAGGPAGAGDRGLHQRGGGRGGSRGEPGRGLLPRRPGPRRGESRRRRARRPLQCHGPRRRPGRRRALHGAHGAGGHGSPDGVGQAAHHPTGGSGGPGPSGAAHPGGLRGEERPHVPERADRRPTSGVRRREGRRPDGRRYGGFGRRGAFRCHD